MQFCVFLALIYGLHHIGWGPDSVGIREHTEVDVELLKERFSYTLYAYV